MAKYEVDVIRQGCGNEKENLTETNSVDVNRQKQNYTEERVIEWLKTEGCGRTTHLDRILDNVLYMHRGLQNYRIIDFFEKQKAEKLIANEEVVLITVETLIQWFATPVGYSFLQQMKKVIEEAFPEENRRRHSKMENYYRRNIKKKKPLFEVIKEVRETC